MEYVKVEVYISSEFEEILINTLNDLGYIGDELYDRVYTSFDVEGHWRSKEGSNPVVGKVGEISFSVEKRVEFRIKHENIYNVDDIIRQIHPYESPVINYIPLLNIEGI